MNKQTLEERIKVLEESDRGLLGEALIVLESVDANLKEPVLRQAWRRYLEVHVYSGRRLSNNLNFEPPDWFRQAVAVVPLSSDKSRIYIDIGKIHETYSPEDFTSAKSYVS